MKAKSSINTRNQSVVKRCLVYKSHKALVDSIKRHTRTIDTSIPTKDLGAYGNEIKITEYISVRNESSSEMSQEAALKEDTAESQEVRNMDQLTFTKVRRKRHARDSDSEEEPQQKIHSTSGKTQPLHFETRNPFTPLAGEPESQQASTSEEDTHPPKQVATPDNAKIKPPPIVIHGKPNDNQKFLKYVEASVKKGFQIKHAAETTNIHVNDPQEWSKFQEVPKLEKREFHTFTQKTEKTHAFVLRGLDHVPETVVARELQTKKH